MKLEKEWDFDNINSIPNDIIEFLLKSLDEFFNIFNININLTKTELKNTKNKYEIYKKYVKKSTSILEIQ